MKRKLLAAACLGLFVMAFSQRSATIVHEYITEQNSRSEPFFGDFEIDSEVFSASLNSYVVKLQHTINGLPVYNSSATVLIRDGKVIYYQQNWINDQQLAPSKEARLSMNEVLQKIENQLTIKLDDAQILAFDQSETGFANFIKKRLLYFKKDDNLHLAYETIFPVENNSEMWSVIVDAHSGEILQKQNLTLSCSFDFNHDAAKGQAFQTLKSPENSTLKNPDQASYRVYPFPIESPNFGSRALVSNPWDLLASPEGWHSDGVTHYTITRGNNVYAYEDVAGDNSPGFSPNGGNQRIFDFPLDFSKNPEASLSASITNLFYAVNKSHDIFYRLGFNEASKNFQANNFGRGGQGNDEVLAEAQDSEDLNNSNFTVTPEGTKPRMQMFLWSPSYVQYLFYNQPLSATSRMPEARTALFGPSLDATGISADVAITSVNDACTSLTANSLVGKIGLAERGNCNFTVKVKNIQDAGGVGAIIYNATNSPAIGLMAGSDASITIPSILIENNEGQFIKNTISSGTNVNVTLKHDSSQDVFIDGSLDNGIIIHEYVHGVTNRLTGNGYSCLNKNVSAEQMGEGWSDFFALMLTNTDTTSPNTPRSIASFAAGQDEDGGGIRPAKYSPDFSINDFTYGRTNGMEFEQDGEIVPNVHAIGFVWASMLWDLHWKFAAKYGYSANIIDHPNRGSAKVTQLVLDALRLQECNPTFVNGRDAILAADMAANNGENRCMIWDVFARRGLGVDASSGAKKDINDQTEDFKLPYECNANATPIKEVVLYPNPAKSEFNIVFPIANFGKTVVEIYDASGRLIDADERLVVTTRQTFSISGLENGVYYVKLRGEKIEKTFRVMVRK